MSDISPSRMPPVREATKIRKTWTMRTFAIAVVAAILVVRPSGSPPRGDPKPGAVVDTSGTTIGIGAESGTQPGPVRGQSNLIAITTSADHLVLTDSGLLFRNSASGPVNQPVQGSFSVNVLTSLPEWGVALEAQPVQGPQGILPPDRIWGRTAATLDSFVPLNHQVPAIIGNVREPMRSSPVDIAVRPRWQDPTGAYEGRLVMRQFLPSASRAGPVLPADQALLGTPVTIGISFSIPEIVSLQVSSSEMSFDADRGPGVYRAKDSIRVNFSTNAIGWQIICQSPDLRSDQNEPSAIPPNRISWELQRSDSPQRTSGVLSRGATILKGNGPVSDLELQLSFSIKILPGDLAGRYQGSVSLVGETEQ